MKNKQSTLSKKRIERIRAQGYFGLNDQQIKDIAFGNRFAYKLCVAVLIVGVVTANIPVLTAMLLAAFGSVVLPNHLFDYIYNWVLAKPMGKPKLPMRSNQLKFACGLATTFIGTTILLFLNDMALAGYITGAVLLSSAIPVSLVDFCLPSITYNHLFKIKA